MKNRLLLLILSLLYINTSSAQRILINASFADSALFVKKKAKLNELSASDFKPFIYHSKGSQLPYRLLAPLQVKVNEKYPLIIALHNSSRIGTDNQSQLEPLTRMWLLENIRNNYPAFVLAPQFAARPTIYAQNDQLGIITAKAQDNLQPLISLIDSLIQNEHIDKQRIYLIGYSMGASTAQHLLSQRPELFAAMIAIAGVPDLSNPTVMLNRPIWLIHGKMDTDNPFSGSIKLFESLKGNKTIQFSMFENLNHHNITFPFLDDDRLATWLFKWKNVE